MTTSSHAFFQDSRLTPSTSFRGLADRAPTTAIAQAIAATLDEALHAALLDLGEDEDALRRALEGDDRLDDAADDDDLEDTQPLRVVRRVAAAFTAPDGISDIGDAIDDTIDDISTGREVLDQDLRAEEDQDEPAHELEFFARFGAAA